MAAQATPAECGIQVEPVEKVLSWSRENAIRAILGEQLLNYEEFKIEFQREEQ